MFSIMLAVSLVLCVVLYAWGRWVSRRRRGLVFRVAARGTLVGAVLALAGVAWAMRQLAAASGASSSPVAGAATQLADQISQTFTMAALPVGLGNLILLASLTVLVVGTLRAPDQRL